MYVVLTPLIAFARLPAPDRPPSPGSASRSRRSGSRCSPGSTPARLAGDLLVLGGAAVYSLQIVLMERYAPRYDALGFTLVEMLAAFAAARGRSRAADLSRRRTAGRSGARCSSPASSRARSRSSCRRGRSGARARRGPALVFTLEPVWAAHLRLLRSPATASARVGWAGCAVIMAGIVLAEPAAAGASVASARGSARDARSCSRSPRPRSSAAMTVAIRIALARGADADAGGRCDDRRRASRVDARSRRRRADDYAARVAVLPRRPARARAVSRSSSRARSRTSAPSRTSVAVGDGAALRASRSRFIAPRRAGRGAARRRRGR